MILRRVVAAAGLVLLVACGEGGGGSQDSAGEPAPAEEGGADLAGQAVDPTREIIYIADLVVRAEDVRAAADAAVTLAEDAGGFVLSSDLRLEPSVFATLVLRVPPQEFEAVLAGLGDLGSVDSQSVQAEDVTAQVVDLESRIASMQASVERLRELIAEAPSVGDVVAIEGQLASREADLESLQAQLRVVRDDVDLATITLQLFEPSSPEIRDDVPGFLSGLRAGWVAFVNFVQVVLTALGAVLPFAVFAALVVFGIVRLARWRARRRPPRPAPPWVRPGPPPGWGPPGGSDLPPPPPVPAPPPAVAQRPDADADTDAADAPAGPVSR